jgi:hypothetical protein
MPDYNLKKNILCRKILSFLTLLDRLQFKVRIGYSFSEAFYAFLVGITFVRKSNFLVAQFSKKFCKKYLEYAIENGGGGGGCYIL